MTSAVRMDPRIADRRGEVQRAASRRRLQVIMVIATVAALVGLGVLCVNSPLLDVDSVRVAGTAHLSPAAVRRATGVHTHDALLLVDTGAVARRIEQLPWVQHASVRRDLPGTLRIAITEFEPTAYVRVAGGVMLVAANGRVVARVATRPAGALEVRGVRHAPKVGELLAPPEAAAIGAALPSELAKRVAAVNVGDGGLALDLRDGGAIRLGRADALAAKSAAALAVLAENADVPFAYIDVSTPQTPVLHR